MNPCFKGFFTFSSNWHVGKQHDTGCGEVITSRKSEWQKEVRREREKMEEGRGKFKSRLCVCYSESSPQPQQQKCIFPLLPQHPPLEKWSAVHRPFWQWTTSLRHLTFWTQLFILLLSFLNRNWICFFFNKPLSNIEQSAEVICQAAKINTAQRWGDLRRS